jgi:hypothetical protein
MLEVRDERPPLRPVQPTTEDKGGVKCRPDRPPDTREFRAVCFHHREPPLPGHRLNGGHAKGDDDGSGGRRDVTHESPVAGEDRFGRWFSDSRDWPKSAQQLGTELRRLAPDLRRLERIEIVFSRLGSGRAISVVRERNPLSQPSSPSFGRDRTDGDPVARLY